MLQLPKPPVRMVIDSDVDNEVDDYFALTWILQSPESFQFTCVIWDLICVAWLLNPGWVPTALRPSPILTDDLYWKHAPGRPVIREATEISRTGTFKDLFTKPALPPVRS